MPSEDENLPVGPPSKSKLCRLFRLVAVSFGFLCVLQAALNISLRLISHRPDTETPDNEAVCKNLTEERDELKRKLTDYERKTLDTEARFKALTEERDKMKTKLMDIVKANYSQQGWMYFGGSFYYISSARKSWQESRDDCLQRGADLMVINSQEEQNFTRQLKDNLWIGLTDSESEGTWRWVDGTPLTISFWLDGEPNSYEDKDEDCGEIRFHKMENSWNDKPCHFQIFWICEKEASV